MMGNHIEVNLEKRERGNKRKLEGSEEGTRLAGKVGRR
jgi:hypothetical protein